MFYEALFLIVLLTLISAVVCYLVRLWLEKKRGKHTSSHPLDATFEAAYTPATARQRQVDLAPEQPESNSDIPQRLEPSGFEESTPGHELTESMSRKHRRLKHKQRKVKRKEWLRREKSI